MLVNVCEKWAALSNFCQSVHTSDSRVSGEQQRGGRSDTHTHTRAREHKQLRTHTYKIMFYEEKSFNLKTFVQFLNYTNWRRKEAGKDETSEQWWLLLCVARALGSQREFCTQRQWASVNDGESLRWLRACIHHMLTKWLRGKLTTVIDH